MDWNKFVTAAKTAKVEDDTIDVLEAEGFDEKPDDLMKLTSQAMANLRLDPEEAEKTLGVISGFKKPSAKAPAPKTKPDPKKPGDKKSVKTDSKYASAKSKAIDNMSKLVSKLLNNISLTAAFILSAPDQKGEQKQKQASEANARILPDLKELANATNALTRSELAVKQAGVRLVKTANALMSIMASVGGGNPSPQMRQYLMMTLEQFEGAVTFFKLACAGKLTDPSSSTLLAAAGKGVDDRLLDLTNACKTFAFSARIMAEDKKAWKDAVEGLWVSGKGVIETLKHLSRMLLQEASATQLLATVKGARQATATLLAKASCLDESALKASNLGGVCTAFDTQLSLLTDVVKSVEGESSVAGTAAALRRAARAGLAKALALASSCANVCQAIPELKALQAKGVAAHASVVTFIKLLRAAVSDSADTTAHTALMRKSGPVGECLEALAAEALKAVPAVRKIGNTDNLEKRIQEAKGAFDAVRRPVVGGDKKE